MKKKRLVFAGLDIANKPGKWALAFRKKGYKTHSLVFSPNKYGSDADESITKNGNFFSSSSLFSKIIIYFKYLWRLFLLSFHFDLFFLVWPSLYLDIILLRLLGKKVVIITCGDEVRDYDLQEIINRNFEKNEYSYYYGVKKTKKNRRNVLLWKVLANNIIVWRELNLYFYKNRKKIIDFEGHHFYKNKEIQKRFIDKSSTIRIVHAPSNKAAKGSEFIKKAISELKAEGFNFVYEELHNVDNSVVQKKLEEADIAIDQLIIGDIGSFSFEAMNNNCMVIAYVLEFIMEKYQLPVFNSSKKEIYSDLKYLLNNTEVIKEYQDKCKYYFIKKCEESKAIEELKLKLKL